MKKLLLLCFVIILSVNLQAQETAAEKKATKSKTEKLAKAKKEKAEAAKEKAATAKKTAIEAQGAEAELPYKSSKAKQDAEYLEIERLNRNADMILEKINSAKNLVTPKIKIERSSKDDVPQSVKDSYNRYKNRR